MATPFNSIEDAIKDIKKGKFIILVDDEDRRAELGGDVGDRHTGDRHPTVVVANGVVRPHIRCQREHVVS